jgi:hypothetical protein
MHFCLSPRCGAATSDIGGVHTSRADEPFDEELVDQRAYTEACVRTALKRYNRRRGIKNGARSLLIAAAAVVPWYFDFAGASVVVWFVGLLVLVAYGQTEQRLRTMQIRLATMHDLLHRIAGDSPDEQDELLMELVAEVGPVQPDKKLWPKR